MLRFNYPDSLIPPAPFVNVFLECPTVRIRALFPAQVDTGADRTILPRRIIDAMSLIEHGVARFQGFDGEEIVRSIYTVEISIEDLPVILIEAAAGEHERYILLGRDFLNHHRIILDGPNLRLDIE